MLTVEDFQKQYGDVDLTFDSYYKFTFTFAGTAPDGVRIAAGFGGNSDDIYREDVNNNEKRKLGAIEGTWYKVQAWRGDEQIFDYYNY
jgi:hypothetical protein